MMKEVRFAHQRYQRALQEKKANQAESEKNRAVKRKLESEMLQLTKKRKQTSLEKEEELANLEKQTRDLQSRIDSL